MFIQFLVVGGSFGLREFTQIRYDAQKIRKKVCWESTLTLHTFDGIAYDKCDSRLKSNSGISTITRNQWKEPRHKCFQGSKTDLYSQGAMTPPSGQTHNCTRES